ncbi:hypothetical protein VTN00DRAFT_526 [Thermoascus crustaceus]|uniref:uncharacterized protein n=1 Tax=Thermoascus crustaceus TaxID=5088 RepID=UPI003742553B
MSAERDPLLEELNITFLFSRLSECACGTISPPGDLLTPVYTLLLWASVPRADGTTGDVTPLRYHPSPWSNRGSVRSSPRPRNVLQYDQSGSM